VGEKMAKKDEPEKDPPANEEGALESWMKKMESKMDQVLTNQSKQPEPTKTDPPQVKEDGAGPKDQPAKDVPQPEPAVVTNTQPKKKKTRRTLF
jgi:hypothetical protein